MASSKFVDEKGRTYTATKKAYKNEGFINSSQARNIRIMCEYEETLLRLKENKIKASVLFFGSARAKDRKGWEAEIAKAEAALAAAMDDDARKAAEKNLNKWKKCEWMGESAEKVSKLAELVTEWAVSPRCVLGREHSFQGVTRYHHIDPRYSDRPSSRAAREQSMSESEISSSGPDSGSVWTVQDRSRKRRRTRTIVKHSDKKDVPAGGKGSAALHHQNANSGHGWTAHTVLVNRRTGPPKVVAGPGRFAALHTEKGTHQYLVVCTGGGPGFMEAANKGASRVPGSRSMGMGITLPFEEGLNEFVTDELAFEFHYFFTRKFWMLYHCQALVVAPGGFGTLDELFEVLTLKQTGKVQKSLPVILFGKDYWQSVINWQSLVDFGTIAQDDVDSLFFTDDPQDALEYLVNCLSNSKGGGNEEL